MHKTERGQAAVDHLKVLVGTPPPYDRKKNQIVVPATLKAVQPMPTGKFAFLGVVWLMKSAGVPGSDPHSGGES